MVHEDFKDLARRAASDKILCDKVFAKNKKYDGYQRGLPSVDYKPFNKKTSGGTVKNESNSNKGYSRRIAQTNY